jgi:hypothetical protein
LTTLLPKQDVARAERSPSGLGVHRIALTMVPILRSAPSETVAVDNHAQISHLLIAAMGIANREMI